MSMSNNRNTEVVLIGQIREIKNITTLKGSEMAVFQLENQQGTVQVVVLPEAFAKSGEYVIEDEIVVVHGEKSSDEDGKVDIFAKKITPIEEAEKHLHNK